MEKDEKSEPTPEEVELVVTQEDHEAGLKRGWTDDDMLKPGRYKMKRGGFLVICARCRVSECNSNGTQRKPRPTFASTMSRSKKLLLFSRMPLPPSTKIQITL
jgi:hypothetical protein